MHALTSDALPEAPGCRRVVAIADLAEIFEPGVQVCMGAVHRSPDVPPGAGRRVIITLDPLWPD